MILHNFFTHFQWFVALPIKSSNMIVHPVDDLKWPIILAIGINASTSTISWICCEIIHDPNLLWSCEIRGVA